MSVAVEALRHYDAGRNVVPIAAGDKKPIGRNWHIAWRDREKLAAYFAAHPDANLGLVLGESVIDIEADSPAEEEVLANLFAGVEIPRTPCFRSTRGMHRFFKPDGRLAALGKAVIYVEKLGIRVGSGAAQSVIPPSIVAGVPREWEVSFDDCEPAELPAVVVDRILAAQQPGPVAAIAAAAVQPGDAGPAVAAMLRLDMSDNGDGSKRLFAYACRAVEHNLGDPEAVAAIRQAAESKPFPRHWSDAQILARVRDAEGETVRGKAILGIDLWKPEGRTHKANGTRLAMRSGAVMRWADQLAKWLIWDGTRWAIDEHCAADGHAKNLAKELWKEFANSACDE